MTKTLAVIINYNRKSYTDQLYESLHPFVGDIYDLVVLDNASTEESEVSSYTTYRAESNSYFGGAINHCFQLILQNNEYDSLLVLNNDIILHGYTFVKTLRDIMFNDDYAVLSPCALQPEKNQCYWKQMHNWATPATRTVKWVDFMCPLIRRDVIEDINQYDMDMVYGWGQDVYTGVICEETNRKIGVVDRVPVIHLSSQTFKDSKSDITMSEYGKLAMNGMYEYFSKINKLHKLNEFRDWGHHYKYEDTI